MPSPQLPIVVRLTIIGVLITWPLAAAAAASPGQEGSLIDPVGGILVFHDVMHPRPPG